jgi:photosystem II stability/assembly factor-like uncharacterized protein
MASTKKPRSSKAKTTNLPKTRTAKSPIASFSTKPGILAILAGVLILVGGLWVLLSRANTTQDQWYVLPIRDHTEWGAYNAGDNTKVGGEGMQYPKSITRSVSNPDVLYISHDVGQVWRSNDNGKTWLHTLGKGLSGTAMFSIAVDPVDANKVYAITSKAYDPGLKDEEGLYMSTDGGDNWSRKLDVAIDTKIRERTTNPYAQGSRENQQNITFAPSSVDSKGAKIWYLALDCGNGDGPARDCSLYKSVNYGDNWSRVNNTTTPDFASYGDIHNLMVHPTDSNILYLSSSTGLYKSTNAGVTFSKVSSGLPSGNATWISIDPKNSSKHFVTVQDNGLYVTSNNGSTYTLLKAHSGLSVFVSPKDSNYIYLLGSSAGAKPEMTIVSSDGGVTWSSANTPSLGYLHDYWTRNFKDFIAGLSPDPRDAKVAVAYYKALLFRTGDGGKNWSKSSNLFTGHAWSRYSSGVSFDQKNPNVFGFFNYDFGMTLTTNGGGSFEVGRHNLNDTVGEGHIWSGSIKPGSNGANMVASGGKTRTLITSSDSGKTWTIPNAQHQAINFVNHHPTDGTTVYAGRYISTNGGNSFSFKSIPGSNNLGEMLDMSKDGNTLLASEMGSYKKVWRSTDKGANWQEVASFSATMSPLNDRPASLAIHPTDNNIFYYKDSNGDVAKYNITTKTSTPLGLKSRNAGINTSDNAVYSITVDPIRPEVIYAQMSKPGSEIMWRSVDGGQNWVNINKNLPRLGGFAMKVNPHTGDLFIGSLIGTWIYPRPAQFASSYSQPSIASTNKVVSYNSTTSTAPTATAYPRTTSTSTPTATSTVTPTTTSTVTPTTTTTVSPTPTTTVSPSSTPIPTPSPTPTPTPTPTTDTTAPSAPTNVKASIIFDYLRFSYYTKLTWSASYDNVGVTSYEVKRNGSTLTSTTTPSTKDYNIVANNYYAYEVYARDAAGNRSVPSSTRLIGRCFLIWCWAE